MKKFFKQALLSTCLVTALASLSTGTVLLTATGNEEATTRFEMVDGAAIRTVGSKGLRFIAEMGSAEYADLTMAESGITKKMGMFIMPYSYLTEEDKYSNGAAGVQAGSYENITTKINHVFYSSDDSVDNKIYEYTDENGDTYYRANGVIGNLYLHNYDTEFVGIAYVSETVGGVTTYTYADFNYKDNVRSSAYVALEAYPDYADNGNALKVFNQYINGAHLQTLGVTENKTDEKDENGNKKFTYTYGSNTYDSIEAVTTAMANCQYSITLDKQGTYVKLGDETKITATVTDVTNNVTFNGAHAAWRSSDESVVTVDSDGTIKGVGKGAAVLTAQFGEEMVACIAVSEAISFENGKVPAFFAKSGTTQSLSATQMTTTDGNTALEIKSNTNTGTTNADRAPALQVPVEFLEAYFSNESVDYIAFDAKSGTTNTSNFRRVTLRSNGTFAADPYEEDNAYNGIKSDAFKTFYFSRADYQAWLDNGTKANNFIATGNFNQGDSIYVDNIRPVTAEERAAGIYSYESGGVRLNDNDQTLLFYTLDGGWQFNIQVESGKVFTNVGYVNDNVTGGVRALKFTKAAGSFQINFPSTKVSYTNFVANTGYYAVDIYVPAGSDTAMSYHITTWPGAPLKAGAWNTIYVGYSNNAIKITDTTGGTYMLDNMRVITEEEYHLAGLSFEANASGLRTSNLGDSTAAGGAVYYYGGADHKANVFSFAIVEGNGTGDTNALSNVRYDSTVTHDGNQSLAFDKGSGYMYLTMRNDSTAYSLLKGGFSFWIYTTTAINGSSANNFINGLNGKFNSGAGITIPANTWTRVLVTADDINSGGRFLIMQGSWAGTIHMDGFKPLDGVYTVTYNANGGTVDSTTQSVVYGEQFNVKTPTSYRDFLGWKDEDGNFVESGVWNYERNVTLTAVYSDKVSFEDGIIPTYMTKAGSTESLTVVDMDTTDGNKALKIQSTASGISPALYTTVEFLASFFVDENVDYIAFNAKTGSSRANNFRRYTMHSSGSMNNITYEYDVAYNGIYADAWKTFYFSREDYNYWVANGVTANNFIVTGSFNAGDCIYLDNIRAATAEEYAEGEYGFEVGGVRLDGNNLLFYTHNGQGTWQFGILPGATLTSYSYTNETVSDGIRAFSFTQAANTTTTIRFNTNATTVMQTAIMNATGYYAFDLYVEEGVTPTLTYSGVTNSVIPSVTPVGGGWTTIYVKNNTTMLKIADTVGGTYTIDNFRSVTEKEFNAAALGFEAGAGGLRTNLLAANNVFYYYGLNNGGTDYTNVKYSICFNGGTGATLSNARYDSEIVHGGKYSLAFEKTNGGMSLLMNASEGMATYPALKNGFTFWLYSTVAINGTTTANFIDGAGNKLGEEDAGINVKANTWTQIRIDKSGIVDGKFLTIQGSTGGTFYIDDIEPLPKSEWEVEPTYNATIEETEQDGTVNGLLLNASTHTASKGLDAAPDLADTEDMSYYRFNGSYGLNDFLVFDFTGDNVPLISFFTTEVTNTIYNHAEDANVKGWIFANGFTTMRGLPFGGLAGAHANRLTMIGPYMVSYKFDDNGTGTALTQLRTSEGSASSPSPIAMAPLQSATNPYRMIIGWVENSSYMNLQICVLDLTTGQQVVNYNLSKGLPKADWEGDIVLYGHFGRETYVDKVYPIVEDTTMDGALEAYAPTTLVYNGTWGDDGSLTLAASTHVGSTGNIPLNSGYQEDMSYIAFDGEYGLNDYVVFDFTGDNFPFITFFNSHIQNTIFNFANDTSVEGWIIANGIKSPNGNSFGGDTGAHANRILFVGSNKISYRYDDNGSTSQWRTSIGSASSPSPIAIAPLKSVTDTYRAIVGYVDNGGNGAKARIYVINMVTGAVVANYTQALANPYSEGSIMLHGQFGTGTVLDKVFGVEEDTTIDALIAKYGKDTDYSDEEAVTIERYAYSSLSNGQWTLDDIEQVTSPTDHRQNQESYNTYAEAGFNVLLAQDMISTDVTLANWETSSSKAFMDMAHAAGLKVILTDWHVQVLSSPIKVTDKGAVAADGTYVPWIIGTDASATSGVAADYLSYLSDLGITADTTRFANRDTLDKWLYDQIAPYKDHPAFYGVMLADEPSYHNAYCYGEVYKSLKRIMPEIYVQYNLLPLESQFSTIQYRYPGVNSIGSGISNSQITTKYKAYLESFLDSMGTDYIQYDDYPFKSKVVKEWWELSGTPTPYVDNTSLRNIQVVAEIAKARNLDVKVVTQTLAMNSGGANGDLHIRQITEDDARWLNNYLMGFGVKQINYYTYWTKSANSASGEYFLDGASFVNRNGETTELYDIMKTIMADNDKFAPAISHFDYNGSKVVTGSSYKFDDDHIAWDTMTADSFRWISSVTTSTDATLVTELYDAEKYNYMYMLMNTIDPNEKNANGKDTTQSITVTFDSSVKEFYVYDQYGNRTTVTGNTYTVSLYAGQAVYLLPKF